MLQTAHEHTKRYSKYFHSFCAYPKIRFDSQQDDEEVVLLVRGHPITFVPWVAISIALFLFPMFFNIFITDFFNIRELIFINLFWYCLLFSYVLINILYWLFNVGLITNKRVVDVDYSMVIYKEVTGSSIGDVTDATARTAGFLGSLLKYGDVFVQTPGIHQNIEFLAIPEPDTVVAILNDLMQE